MGWRSISPPENSSTNLVNSGTAYKVLADMSSSHGIYTIGDAPSYVLLGPPTLEFDVDYTATSVAVSTQCRRISRACGIVIDDISMQYNCTEKNSGVILSGDLI